MAMALHAAVALPSPAPAADAGRATGEPKAPPGSSAAPAPADAAAADELDPGLRAVAVGGALVPGLLVHGTGHWIAGRPQTARRLALAEATGLGLVLLGGIPIVATGASRYFVGPSAVLVVGGMGLFTTSLLADVYGVAVPYDARGAPLRTAPRLLTSLGYAYVYDPQFAYRHFVRQGVDLRVGRLALRPSAWFAVDDPNSRVRLLGAYRLSGPLPDAGPAADGSFAEIELGVVHHRYHREGFRTLTGELSIGGRIDLQRLDAGLHGLFGEGSFGWALQAFEYDAPGLRLGSEVEELLLARFGLGAYLDRRGSEALFYYDHRHDDYAAGAKMGGLGSGVPGHFGLSSRVYVSAGWGVGADAEVGSAYIVGVSVLRRVGHEP